MESVVDRTAAVAESSAKGCNSAGFSGAVAMKGEEMVKQLVDRKGPLKGKGGALAQWHREAVERLEAVHQAMNTLAQSVRTVQGRRWSLNVYRLRTNAKQLRWRETGADRKHSLWDRVERELSQLPPGLAQWYREVEATAQILNHKEQVARYEMKTVMRLVKGKPPREAREYIGE
jgi:hypothetical protein